MTDMMDYVGGRLRGYYPSSKKTTHELIAEMAAGFEAAGCSQAEFDDAVYAWRKSDSGHYCPEFRDLKPLLPKKHYDRRWQKFAGIVLWHGWDHALHLRYRMRWIDAILKEKEITDNDLEYFGFADWFARMCRILHHEGDPAKAFDYGATYGPGFVRPHYAEKAAIFKRMGVERAKSYFGVFRWKKRYQAIKEEQQNRDIPF
jgi:hypothetical protein